MYKKHHDIAESTKMRGIIVISAKNLRTIILLNNTTLLNN